MIPARLQWPVGIAVVLVAALLPFVVSSFTTSQLLTRTLILGIAEIGRAHV